MSESQGNDSVSRNGSVSEGFGNGKTTKEIKERVEAIVKEEHEVGQLVENLKSLLKKTDDSQIGSIIGKLETYLSSLKTASLKLLSPGGILNQIIVKDHVQPFGSINNEDIRIDLELVNPDEIIESQLSKDDKNILSYEGDFIKVKASERKKDATSAIDALNELLDKTNERIDRIKTQIRELEASSYTSSLKGFPFETITINTKTKEDLLESPFTLSHLASYIKDNEENKENRDLLVDCFGLNYVGVARAYLSNDKNSDTLSKEGMIIGTKNLNQKIRELSSKTDDVNETEKRELSSKTDDVKEKEKREKTRKFMNAYALNKTTHTFYTFENGIKFSNFTFTNNTNNIDTSTILPSIESREKELKSQIKKVREASNKAILGGSSGMVAAVSLANKCRTRIREQTSLLLKLSALEKRKVMGIYALLGLQKSLIFGQSLEITDFFEIGDLRYFKEVLDEILDTIDNPKYIERSVQDASSLETQPVPTQFYFATYYHEVFSVTREFISDILICNNELTEGVARVKNYRDEYGEGNLRTQHIAIHMAFEMISHIRPLIDYFKTNSAKKVLVFCRINDIKIGSGAIKRDFISGWELARVYGGSIPKDRVLLVDKNFGGTSINVLELGNKMDDNEMDDDDEIIEEDSTYPIEIKNEELSASGKTIKNALMKKYKCYVFDQVFPSSLLSNPEAIASFMRIHYFLDNAIPMCLFTFGYSGTGKSYTLLGSSTGQQGIISAALGKVSKMQNLEVRVFEYYLKGVFNKDYWLNDGKLRTDNIDQQIIIHNLAVGNSTGEPAISLLGDARMIAGNEIDSYVLDTENETFVTIPALNVPDALRVFGTNVINLINERRIKQGTDRTTINNYRSSRSILIYHFRVTIGGENGKKSQFLLVDMPGREDVYKTYTGAIFKEIGRDGTPPNSGALPNNGAFIPKYVPVVENMMDKFNKSQKISAYDGKVFTNATEQYKTHLLFTCLYFMPYAIGVFYPKEVFKCIGKLIKEDEKQITDEILNAETYCAFEDAIGMENKKVIFNDESINISGETKIRSLLKNLRMGDGLTATGIEKAVKDDFKLVGGYGMGLFHASTINEVIAVVCVHFISRLIQMKRFDLLKILIKEIADEVFNKKVEAYFKDWKPTDEVIKNFYQYLEDSNFRREEIMNIDPNNKNLGGLIKLFSFTYDIAGFEALGINEMANGIVNFLSVESSPSGATGQFVNNVKLQKPLNFVTLQQFTRWINSGTSNLSFSYLNQCDDNGSDSSCKVTPGYFSTTNESLVVTIDTRKVVGGKAVTKDIDCRGQYKTQAKNLLEWINVLNDEETQVKKNQQPSSTRNKSSSGRVFDFQESPKKRGNNSKIPDEVIEEEKDEVIEEEKETKQIARTHPSPTKISLAKSKPPPNKRGKESVTNLNMPKLQVGNKKIIPKIIPPKIIPKITPKKTPLRGRNKLMEYNNDEQKEQRGGAGPSPSVGPKFNPKWFHTYFFQNLVNHRNELKDLNVKIKNGENVGFVSVVDTDTENRFIRLIEFIVRLYNSNAVFVNKVSTEGGGKSFKPVISSLVSNILVTSENIQFNVFNLVANLTDDNTIKKKKEGQGETTAYVGTLTNKNDEDKQTISTEVTNLINVIDLAAAKNAIDLAAKNTIDSAPKRKR